MIPGRTKRQKEQQRQQKAQEKAAAKQQRKQEKASRPAQDHSQGDPDIAGIVPGPQPIIEQ